MDLNYKAYVGPEENYDLMSGIMFVYMFQLGLRGFHTLLDVGCGSLRGGKLFIPYLDAGKYYGIEPNREILALGIEKELGKEIIDIKKPHFLYNSDFDATGFPPPQDGFDFILAQSIFSHTSFEQLQKAIHRLSLVLKNDGLFVATYIRGEKDYHGKNWAYPECVTYRSETLNNIASQAGLFLREMSTWFHPSG